MTTPQTGLHESVLFFYLYTLAFLFLRVMSDKFLCKKKKKTQETLVKIVREQMLFICVKQAWLKKRKKNWVGLYCPGC